MASFVFGFQNRIAQMKLELGDNAGATNAIQRAIGFIPGQIHALSARYGEEPDARSHGGTFLNACRVRIAAPGLYLLDEPEAALSLLCQMAFLKLTKDAVEAGSQFIVDPFALGVVYGGNPDS